ncbi:MAG TPA: alkaline phosphatase family protein, partial [Myxococcota bacterium]|nr:alkaline phosphatase family protein [Myxococcota bacterium]
MDPVITERLIAEGKLPNFAQLAREGAFQRLGTSNPPQSPVAWSTFATGMNPGGHGIFDFVHRDPATYHPVSSATPPPGEPPGAVELFGYVIPLGGSDATNNRGGTPWWDALVEHGVDVEVFQIPGNFPTPASEAKVLDGMGTVDLRGGFGTYTFYTDALVEKENAKGDIEYVSVQDLDLDGVPDTAASVLRGPPDQFHLAPGELPKSSDYASERLTIEIDPESETAVIEVGGAHTLVAEGEWSPWVEVTFDLLPMGLMPVTGSVRFYAQELRPKLKLYASPVNISPAAPFLPITSPDEFIEEIFASVGFFYTQGMPEEQEALKDRVFSDGEFVDQVELVQRDAKRIVDFALDRFEPGDATFVYLSVDLQCHMLWRHGDPKHPHAPPHPAFEPESGAAHARDIERFYRDVDASLGAIRQRLPDDTLLIAMSDHGFQPYTRKLHLNAWLRDAGYLVLKDGKRTGQIVAGDVDWSKTRAYGIGFNGLYLNRAGREAQGIVADTEAAALMAEIAQKLEALRDPQRGQAVVLEVFEAARIYSGPRTSEAPDLVVGYNEGYGCSDESTLGEITEAVIEDNTSRWSGNHLMSPDVVPGVLLINRRLAREGHDLTDVTATLLAHYGVEPLPDMTGAPIL